MHDLNCVNRGLGPTMERGNTESSTPCESTTHMDSRFLPPKLTLHHAMKLLPVSEKREPGNRGARQTNEQGIGKSIALSMLCESEMCVWM